MLVGRTMLDSRHSYRNIHIYFCLNLVASLLTVGLLSHMPSMSKAVTVVGEDCTLREPLRSYLFNVTGLHNAERDYKIIDNGQMFYLNICGSLKRSCNGHHNVSVCLLTDGEQKENVIGYSNSSLLYEDGRLNFELNGDECKSGVKSKVIIILKCDAAAIPSAEPQIWPSQGCVFYFIWYNRLSCTPHKEIECNTIVGEHLYHLNRLTRHSSNYIVTVLRKNSTRPSLRIELNVCHSVIFGHSVTCEFNSGACAEVLSGNERTVINLGDVTKGPFFENGKLQLRYEMGEVCRDNGPRSNTETVIEFICDKTKEESQPEFFSYHQCIYHFLWKTSAACPLNLNTIPDWIKDTESDEVCKIGNPNDEYQFDLRSLMNQDYHVKINDNHTLLLSVCGPLVNNSCGSNVGSCLVDAMTTNRSNVGIANAVLHLNKPEVKLLLLYSNGTICDIGIGVPWKTLILFVCETDGYAEGPHLISSSNCTYVINWHTELVCVKKIQCVATKELMQVDLTPLVSIADYIVKEKETRFYVGVCRPLQSALSANCSSSGVCFVDPSSKRMLSLGHFIDSPTLNEKGEAVVKYVNGSPCPERPSMKLSSSIVFVCDVTAGLGSPTLLKASSSCQYSFVWRTSLVCANEKEVWSLSKDICYIQDKTTNTSIDLSSLHKLGGYRVMGFSKNYTINLCTSADVCNGAAVCEEIAFTEQETTTASYGQLDRVEHDFLNNYTKLFYSNGVPCVSTRKVHSSSEVWLMCDEDAGVGEPTVLSDSDQCYVLFEWRSAAVCNKVSVKSPPDKDAIPKPRPEKYEVRAAIGFVFIFIAVAASLAFYGRNSHWCIRFRNRLSNLVGFRTQVVYRREEENDDWSEECPMT